MDHRPPPASTLAGFIAWRLMDLDAREPAAEIPWEQLVEATVETAALGVAAGVRSPELALRILAHLAPARSEFDPDALLEMWAFPFVQRLAADRLAPDASQTALLVRVAAEALRRVPETDRAPVRRDRLPGQGDLAAAQTLCLAHGLAFGLTAPELAARTFRDRLRSEIGDGVVPEESVGQLMDLAAAVVHEALLDFERALGPLPEAPAAMRSARLVQERLRG